MEDIAAHCLARLVSRKRHDEWSLVGWSFGGVLAYEMARQMAQSGHPPRRVVLIDSYLPPRASGDAGDPDPFAHGIAPSLDIETLRPLYRANVAALHAYVPAVCDFPVVAICAEQSLPLLTGRDDAPRPMPVTPLRTIILPGDHYTLLIPENGRQLADAIDEALR
jgi:pimeloyl-ACP methyl ester carboxylesterase